MITWAETRKVLTTKTGINVYRQRKLGSRTPTKSSLTFKLIELSCQCFKTAKLPRAILVYVRIYIRNSRLSIESSRSNLNFRVFFYTLNPPSLIACTQWQWKNSSKYIMSLIITINVKLFEKIHWSMHLFIENCPINRLFLPLTLMDSLHANQIFAVKWHNKMNWLLSISAMWMI